MTCPAIPDARGERTVVEPAVVRPPPAFPRALEHHFVTKPIAAGGMASVHLAVSPDRRKRVLALKRLHPHLATDAYFERMLLDEAAIASSVRHPNVVTTYGADMIGDEVFLVMEYVPGLPLHVLMQKAHPGSIPARLAAAIIAGALRGLHAAHQAVDAKGQSLHIVHRDVSPQNILLGTDGVARVLDFGIAMAERRSELTRAGDVKGKLAYMAPEQIHGAAVDRRTDVYSASVVLWEALVGAPVFRADCDGGTVAKVLEGNVERPGTRVPGIPKALDAIVMRGLAGRPQDRFASALDMADALDAVFAPKPVRATELAAWLGEIGAETLREQARLPTDLRRRPAPTTPSGGRTSRLPPAPVQAPPVMNPTVLTRTVKALPVTAPPVTAPPVMTRQMTAPPETGLIAALPAFQKEVAIRAVIFVIAIACGVLTEVAVAGAIHGPSRTAQEESR